MMPKDNGKNNYKDNIICNWKWQEENKEMG